jgi:RNase P/RNase MRP subunit p29
MKNLLKDEMIGKTAKIYYNKKIFEGKIIDETKNTLIIKTKEGNKRTIKINSIIEIDDFKINGKKINKRPEDRIKIK